MLQIRDLRPRVTGDTWPFVIDILDADGAPLSTVEDYTYELSVNAEENPADPATSDVFTLTGTVTDATLGRVEFVPTQEQADDLVPLADAASYWYDVVVTDGADRTVTVLKGRLPVTGNITP